VERPSLRFYYPEALHEKTLALLAAIEKAGDATRHAAALAELVLELTESGLGDYFLRPLQEVKAGFVAEQTARIGTGTMLRVMGPIVRRLIGGMDDGQLRSIAGDIRAMMD
jgi:hypothetical protein